MGGGNNQRPYTDPFWPARWAGSVRRGSGGAAGARGLRGMGYMCHMFFFCNNPKSLFVWWRRSSFSNPILSLFEKMIPLFIPWFLLIFPIKITISVLSIYLHIFRQTHIHITSRGWWMLLSCSAWYQSHEISPIHISIPDPISPWSLGAGVAVADAARRASRGA